MRKHVHSTASPALTTISATGHINHSSKPHDGRGTQIDANHTATDLAGAVDGC